MNFTTKKVNTQTLGEFLRLSRQRLGLSPSDVAKLCLVQPKYLLALEESRFIALPASVYVKGFLKSLAKVYGVSPAELLDRYLREQEISENLKKSQNLYAKPIKFTSPKFIFSPKILTISTVLALGILSLSYLYFQVSSLRRPPAVDISSPLANETVNNGTILIQGKTEPGASLYLNSQPLLVDADGKFQESLSLGPGVNVLKLKSVNKFGQETTVERSVIYQVREIAGVATSTAAIIGNTGLNLEIRIGQEATWIYLEADGVEKFSGTMLPSSTKTVTATDKIALTTGNAGSTHVFLNGKDLGILGKEGEIIRDIEFTPTP